MSSASASTRPKRTIKPTEKLLNSNLGLRKPETKPKLPVTVAVSASRTKSDTINKKTTEVTVPSNKRAIKPTEKLINSSLKLTQAKNSKTKIETATDSAILSEPRTGSVVAAPAAPEATAPAPASSSSSSVEGGRPKRAIKTTEKLLNSNLSNLRQIKNTSEQSNKREETQNVGKDGEITNLKSITKDKSDKVTETEKVTADHNNKKQNYGLPKNIQINITPIDELVEKKPTKRVAEIVQKSNLIVKRAVTRKMKKLEESPPPPPPPAAVKHGDGKKTVGSSKEQAKSKLDKISETAVKKSNPSVNVKTKESQMKSSDKLMAKADDNNKETSDQVPTANNNKEQNLPVKKRKMDIPKVDKKQPAAKETQPATKETQPAAKEPQPAAKETQPPTKETQPSKETQPIKDAEIQSTTVEPIRKETSTSSDNNNLLQINTDTIELKSNENVMNVAISDVENPTEQENATEQENTTEQESTIESESPETPEPSSNKPIEKQNAIIQKPVAKIDNPIRPMSTNENRRPPRNIKKPQRFIEQHSDGNSSNSILNIDKCSKKPAHIPIYRFIENIPSLKTKTSRNTNPKVANDIYSLTNFAEDLSDGDDDPAKDIIKKLRKEKKVTVKNQIRKKQIVKKKEKPFWMNKNMPKTIVQMNIKKSNNQVIVSRPNQEIINHIMNTNTDKLLNQISIKNLNINDDVDNINLSFDLSSCGGSGGGGYRDSVGVGIPVGQSTPKMMAPPVSALKLVQPKRIPTPANPLLTLNTKTLSNNNNNNNQGAGNGIKYRNNININNNNTIDKVTKEPPSIKDISGVETVNSDNSDAENVQPDDYVSIQKELMNRSQNIIINRKRNAIPIRKPLQTLTAFNTAMAELRKPTNNGIQILRNIQISKPIQHYLNEATEISMASAAPAPTPLAEAAATTEYSDESLEFGNDFPNENNPECISHETALFGFEDYINNSADDSTTENISLNNEKLKCLLAEQRKKNIENISTTSIGGDDTSKNNNQLQMDTKTGQGKNNIPKTQSSAIFTDLNDKRNQHKDIREVFQEIALKQKTNKKQNRNDSDSSSDNDVDDSRRTIITSPPLLQGRTNSPPLNTNPIIFHDLPKPESNKPPKHYAGKRKRKINFELDNEDNDENEKELPPPKSKKPSKAKKLQDEKFNQELNAFAEEFNSMCEEVNGYNVVIEKV